jgi:hypothetical protein
MDDTNETRQSRPVEATVMPLRCEVRGMGWIDMGVSIGVLRFAAEQHPEFWDGQRPDSEPNIKITDSQKFAREVVAEINRESEDGSTLLTRMLDKAISNAVEAGCEGVNHDAE